MLIEQPVSLEKARFLVEQELQELIKIADPLRKDHKGDTIFTCAIINAKSGACPEDCAFCAQSAHHKTEIDVYPLVSEDRIVRMAEEMKKSGATRFSIVTSGNRLKDREIESVANTIRLIREKVGIRVCASLGMLDEDMARILKDAGLDRYHHNLETAKSFFPNICTTHAYEEDIETLWVAKNVGLKVCSGGIMGLGEGWEHRIELAFTLREIDVDSIPINFLNPIPGTRLQDMPLLAPTDALKAIAIFRIINPEKDITICGGREKVIREYQSDIFAAGANGIMIGNYLTTKGRGIKEDMEMIEKMGLNLEDKND
ncbi:MAG: biotin synthase BioB [Deltaproteobacteria bacterium]|nr:MAG: biotin synthase BioB [Deltaproteobacteria bacterium]